jgi:hypothetical protein
MVLPLRLAALHSKLTSRSVILVLAMAVPRLESRA